MVYPFGKDTERLFAMTLSISSGVMMRTASSSICPLPLIAQRMAAKAYSSASAIAINSRPPLVGTKYASLISAPMARNLSLAHSTQSTAPCSWMALNALAVNLPRIKYLIWSAPFLTQLFGTLPASCWRVLPSGSLGSITSACRGLPRIGSKVIDRSNVQARISRC